MPRKSILPATWQVPQVFRDRLGEEAGRQRAMFADGHLLLVLHSPPGPEDEARQGRFFWREPNGAWHSDSLGGGPTALTRHLDEYATIVQNLESQQDRATAAEEYFSVLQAIAPVHRAAGNMHQTLQEARQQVPDDRGVIVWRDRAYGIERMAELLYAETKNALDFDIARRAEEQAKNSNRMARSAHRLNVLAALFFPMATLSAIFGVNLRHPLENDPTVLSFFGMLGAGLLAGVLLTLFVTKK